MTDYADAPAVIPARMLNEFVYCPRLFYIEWVDGQWADNADTTRGDLSHASVDARGGRMPAPGDEDRPYTTSSVRLSDEELGVLAVIDRVDHVDGGCSSVDYKVGHPGPDGEPWPADRAQALVQATLLHRAGYEVVSADLYYRETHSRVSIPWRDDLEDEVRELVTRARETAATLVPPPPLVDSPRCPRCSLVGLCLPDEKNALLGRVSQPKRLMVRNPDQQPLYVTEQGSYVGCRGGQILVTQKGETLARHRVLDVSSLCVFGHVQVTTEALWKLWEAGANVMWFSYGGWLNGWAQGKPSGYSELRRRQVAAHAQGSAVAAAMISGKIRNQRTLLRRNAKSDVSGAVAGLGRLAAKATTATAREDLLGFEGAAARTYFDRFASMLSCDQAISDAFRANGRNRRPPLDPVNASLSFCYSLLVRDVVATCLAVGLDPYIGVLHRNRYGRPAMALDLAEEFRPLVAESVTVSLLNTGQLRSSDFRSSSVGTALTQQGRRTLIAGYERRMATELKHPVFGYSVSYRRALEVQTRILAAVLIGELDAYTPLTTR
ncbi:CRISPR-associated endonuclease Cas4/Cas1 [Propionicicella superfundia]|uniref:CRISPR-associated endonuclease Cas4/Cas1 n=1 Tax=Propionicicella superfundia TaxID=348582 RepID=UPI00042A18DF|nr:CRISPR-associated endonuclease Cas4/Cas1 [Propionicicella superfundia]